jgi:hypothetical protein
MSPRRFGVIWRPPATACGLTPRCTPPVVGKRQPTLKQRLVNLKTPWRRLLVTGWYGHGERMVEIVSATALWNHSGRRVPIRYALVRDPGGELEPQAFLCTDLEADPIDILRWFIRRCCRTLTCAGGPTPD